MYKTASWIFLLNNFSSDLFIEWCSKRNGLVEVMLQRSISIIIEIEPAHL